jgi:hypothetical protein
MHTTFPAYLIFFDLIILIIFGKECELRSSPLCCFLQPRITSSLFCPNIHLGNPVFKHPQSTFLPQYQRPHFIPIQNHRQNYGSVCLNFYVFRHQVRRQKVLDWMVQALPEFIILLISSRLKIWFFTIDPKYLNCATFSKDLLLMFMLQFCPAFWWWGNNTYLVFSVFIPRPTSLLASEFLCFFSLWHLCYLSTNLNHQHSPAADVSHLISVTLRFPGPS